MPALVSIAIFAAPPPATILAFIEKVVEVRFVYAVK
jgi:hypothetical protein